MHGGFGLLWESSGFTDRDLNNVLRKRDALRLRDFCDFPHEPFQHPFLSFIFENHSESLFQHGRHARQRIDEDELCPQGDGDIADQLCLDSGVLQKILDGTEWLPIFPLLRAEDKLAGTADLSDDAGTFDARTDIDAAAEDDAFRKNCPQAFGHIDAVQKRDDHGPVMDVAFDLLGRRFEAVTLDAE